MRLAKRPHHPTRLVAQLGICLLSVCSAATAEPLVDPTRPHNSRSAPRVDRTPVVAGLQLEAILHGSQRRLAIINGQLVREGDRIASNLIESITPTSVRYSRSGQQHTLRLAGAATVQQQLSIRPSARTQLAKEQQP